MLDVEQQYLSTQFMVLHRTRAQGLGGHQAISLESCQAYLAFWPQWDELKFVETMLVADQCLLHRFHLQREIESDDKEAAAKAKKEMQKLDDEIIEMKEPAD